jgi:hypothetical protein
MANHERVIPQSQEKFHSQRMAVSRRTKCEGSIGILTSCWRPVEGYHKTQYRRLQPGYPATRNPIKAQLHSVCYTQLVITSSSYVENLYLYWFVLSSLAFTSEILDSCMCFALSTWSCAMLLTARSDETGDLISHRK